MTGMASNNGKFRPLFLGLFSFPFLHGSHRAERKIISQSQGKVVNFELGQ